MKYFIRNPSDEIGPLETPEIYRLYTERKIADNATCRGETGDPHWQPIAVVFPHLKLFLRSRPIKLPFSMGSLAALLAIYGSVLRLFIGGVIPGLAALILLVGAGIIATWALFNNDGVPGAAFGIGALLAFLFPIFGLPIPPIITLVGTGILSAILFVRRAS